MSVGNDENQDEVVSGAQGVAAMLTHLRKMVSTLWDMAQHIRDKGPHRTTSLLWSAKPDEDENGVTTLSWVCQGFGDMQNLGDRIELARDFLHVVSMLNPPELASFSNQLTPILAGYSAAKKAVANAPADIGPEELRLRVVQSVREALGDEAVAGMEFEIVQLRREDVDDNSDDYDDSDDGANVPGSVVQDFLQSIARQMKRREASKGDEETDEENK